MSLHEPMCNIVQCKQRALRHMVAEVQTHAHQNSRPKRFFSSPFPAFNLLFLFYGINKIHVTWFDCTHSLLYSISDALNVINDGYKPRPLSSRLVYPGGLAVDICQRSVSASLP